MDSSPDGWFRPPALVVIKGGLALIQFMSVANGLPQARSSVDRKMRPQGSASTNPPADQGSFAGTTAAKDPVTMPAKPGQSKSELKLKGLL